MEAISTLLTSLGLGVGAGVNAYATFLVVGLLGRFGPAGLLPSEYSSWLSSTPALIVFGILYSIEFVADKIPAIDHAWDVIHTFVRPLAGVVIALSAANPEMPTGLLVVAGALSGGAALTSHVAKSSLRVGSTATTGGAGNPILSVIEDIFAVVTAVLSIFLPVLVLLLLLFVVLPGALLLRSRMRRSSTVRP